MHMHLKQTMHAIRSAVPVLLSMPATRPLYAKTVNGPLNAVHTARTLCKLVYMSQSVAWLIGVCVS
jgi:hypothetical protein